MRMVGGTSGRFVPKKPTVATEFPEILNQWNDDSDPSQITIGSGREVNWKCGKGHEWSKPPAQRFRNGKVSPCPICKLGPPIAETHPDALLDWNDDSDPHTVTFGSGKKVNWKCHECEHEWKSSPNNRLKKGRMGGCPVCVTGRLHSNKLNSLATLDPITASEWHPDKNGDLTPNDLTKGSDLSVWWLCNMCQNEWETNVYNRTGSGNGCPTCALGRLHSDGRNSLLNIYPELAKEWHPGKNGSLKPSDIASGYGKKVWWYCDKSTCEHPHEWQSAPNTRTNLKTGCPFCNGNQSFCPCDSIVSTHPELVKEIHPDETTKPEELVSGSDIRIKWLCKNSTCEHEHSWVSQVKSRTLKGTGCPYCSNPAKAVCVCNSFGAKFPNWVKMWSEKNGNKTPFDYSPHSSSLAWWQCPKSSDHLWRGKISDRTRKDQSGGCPFCAGKRVSITNCLSKVKPVVAAMWHPEKNGDLTPNDVTHGTQKRVWWKCSAGPDHEWKSQVYRVTSAHDSKYDSNGCPYCAGYKLSVTNRLDLHHPNLVDEWHLTKNKGKKPSDFTTASNKKVWWTCSTCSNEWKAAINNRTAKKPRGCSSCAKTGFDPSSPAFYYVMEISGPTGRWWFKGGISSDPEHRRYLIQHSLEVNKLPLQVAIVSTMYFENGKDAWNLERKLLAIENIRESTVEKFSGSAELFTINPLDYAKNNDLVSKNYDKQLSLAEFD